MSYLVLVRHGKSEWNHLGLWTGLTDVGLVNEGVKQAQNAGKTLKDINFSKAYVSKLKRAQHTLDEILNVFASDISTEQSEALNERNYGIYTGKNKWQVRDEIGEEAFQKTRRSWDAPIPLGESLKDVYQRVKPYYEERILPELLSGKNILIVAHGNSLRALAKHIENIDDEKIAELEIGVGEVYVYELDSACNVIHKDIRVVNTEKAKI